MSLRYDSRGHNTTGLGEKCASRSQMLLKPLLDSKRQLLRSSWGQRSLLGWCKNLVSGENVRNEGRKKTVCVCVCKGGWGCPTETDYQVKPEGWEVRICCLCWEQVRVEQWGSVGTGQPSTWNGMTVWRTDALLTHRENLSSHSQSWTLVTWRSGPGESDWPSSQNVSIIVSR